LAALDSLALVFVPDGGEKCAQQILRDSVAARSGQSRGTAGLSTLMIVKIAQ
jgi:hypothetical protein